MNHLGVALNQQIILVSRDESLIAARLRGEILRTAGFRTTYAESLGRAVSLTFSMQPDLIILEQSFSERERSAFIDCIHGCYPNIPVLYLQYGVARPSLLINACKRILTTQAGDPTVHTVSRITPKMA